MSMNMAQVQDLAGELFRAADTGNERERERALWQLESAFGVVLNALDRSNHGNPGELMLNRQKLVEQLLHALDEGQVRR